MNNATIRYPDGTICLLKLDSFCYTDDTTTSKLVLSWEDKTTEFVGAKPQHITPSYGRFSVLTVGASGTGEGPSEVLITIR